MFLQTMFLQTTILPIMLSNTKRLLPMLLLLLLGISSAYAQRPDNLEPLPEPPPPPGVNSGEALPLGEPQIKIYQRGDNQIKEYRLNGHLYAVRITPESGAPYYLIDADGDGYMEGRFLDNNDAKVMVPMWVLYRW